MLRWEFVELLPEKEDLVDICLPIIDEIGRPLTVEILKARDLGHLIPKIDGIVRMIYFYRSLAVARAKASEAALEPGQRLEKDVFLYNFRHLTWAFGNHPTQTVLQKDLNLPAHLWWRNRPGIIHELSETIPIKPWAVPRGHWQEWDNVSNELRRIARDFNRGKFPSKKLLAAHGLGSLEQSVKKWHGSWEKAKRKFLRENPLIFP